MTPGRTPPRLLVGVDFDDASASALRLAGALADAWTADVTVLHAATLDVPAYFTATQLDALEAERERSRAAIADRLRSFAAPHLRGAVHAVVAEEPPHQALLRALPSFDLIVLGTHRRHGPARWWLGSVAEMVVRQSARPVLVVPSGAAVPEPGRPAAILAAGAPDGGGEAWIDALRTALAGTVVRSPDIQLCTRDDVERADLIVLAMPPAADAQGGLDAIARALRTCARPVLFVPSELLERSSP